MEKLEQGRQLRNWLDSYLLYTDNHEPIRLYKEWMGVATLCAAMGRKVWFPWEKFIYPNMYILLIGPPSARKGTAIFPAKNILRANNVPLCAEAITREAFFEDMEAATVSLKDMPPEYTCEFSSTYTVFSDEFTSFIGYDRGEFLANLCDLWDCPDHWTYRTKGRGVNRMRGVCLNLVAGTTPELLCKNLPAEAIGGGFTSRTIMVYADRKARTITDPRPSAQDKLLFNMLCQDIAHIHTLRGAFSCTDEWLKSYDNFYQEQDRNPPITHFKFEHYLGRRQTHLQKLCMALSIARSDKLCLEQEDFDRAVDLLVRTEKVMPAVFAGHGRVASATIRPRLIHYMRKKGTTTFADLHAHFANDMSLLELEETLKSFYHADEITVKVQGIGPTAPRLITWKGPK